MNTAPTRVPTWAWTVMIGLVILLALSMLVLSQKTPTTKLISGGADVASNSNTLAQFAECKVQYGKLLGIIGEQTDILQGESEASEDAFNAIRDQDLDAFNASTDKVEALSAREGDLHTSIDQLNSAACK